MMSSSSLFRNGWIRRYVFEQTTSELRHSVLDVDNLPKDGSKVTGLGCYHSA
jgi:hypothetical protein